MRIKIVIFMLSCGMVHAAAEINPTNCFADFPWSSQSNQFWYVVETNSFIHKQLWYSLQDRATVCNIGLRPWIEKQYTLGMGWPTVALQRTTNAWLNTNQVQLLYDVTRTNTVTAWTYWSCHPTNQNDVTSHVAIATATTTLYREMYQALGVICSNFVPSRIAKDMTNWIATYSSKEIPIYTSLGAILYDCGEPYSNLVSNITWSNEVITACDYNFGIYSLPDEETCLSYLTWTNVFTLQAADCMATMIAQLKYFVVPVVPCRMSDTPSDYRQYFDCLGAYGTNWGWDNLSKKSIQISPETDYIQSSPASTQILAWAFMGQSTDYTWADNLQRTVNLFDTNRWESNDTINVALSDTNLNTDWPISGWYGKATWDNAIVASNSAGAQAGYRWRLRLDTTWYDMDNVKLFETNITISSEKNLGAFSWGDDWYSDQIALTDSNYVDAYTNVSDVYQTYYGWGGTTNATGGRFDYFAWTNFTAGETFTDLVTYTYFDITKYEFTNTFSTTTDYTNQYWKTNGWYKTNVNNAGTTTDTLYIGVVSNVVDGYWNYTWGSNVALACSGEWDYASVVLTNGVYARAILFDVRPNIPIFVDLPAPDPSAANDSQIKYYFMGLSLERAKSDYSLNVSQPILDLPEWGTDYNWERPYYSAGIEPQPELDAINTNYLAEVSNWCRTPDKNLPYFPIGRVGDGLDWIPFENKKDLDPRYFWGIERGWCVVDYVFTERKTSLPK